MSPSVTETVKIVVDIVWKRNETQLLYFLIKFVGTWQFDP